MPREDRTKYERRLTKLMALLLAEQRGRLIDLAEFDYGLIDEAFWAAEVALLAPALISLLVDTAVYSSQGIIEDVGTSVDPGVILDATTRWARDYSYNLITGINATSRRLVSQAVQQAVSTPGFTLQDFVDMVSPTFGPVRAEAIGVTEITRAAAEGSVETANELRALGVQLDDIWLTNRDDLVCPICAPRHNKKRGDGWQDNPPAHPRCRCTLSHRLSR